MPGSPSELRSQALDSMESSPNNVQVSHGAIQFMVYEELKKAARGPLSTRLGGNRELGSAEISFMGAASKLVASIATYPSQACSQGLCNTLLITSPGGNGKLRPFICCSQSSLYKTGMRLLSCTLQSS